MRSRAQTIAIILSKFKKRFGSQKRFESTSDGGFVSDRAAVEWYHTDGARVINHYLRGNTDRISAANHARARDAVERIDRMLATEPTYKPQIVYRAVRARPDAQPGDLIVEPRYLSTALTRRGAERFLSPGQAKEIIEIAVPKGTPSFNIANRSVVHEDEQELLLPRGATLRVHSRTTDGRLRMVLEPK